MPRIVGLSGVVSKEMVDLIDERPDHKGLYTVRVRGDNTVLQVHGKRLVNDDHDAGTALTIEAYGRHQTLCPDCGEVSILTDSVDGPNCTTHGRYATSSFGKPDMQSTDQNKMIDISEIKKFGELWTKAGLGFDDPNIEAKAHALLATCRDGIERKLCFNTYSGSFGKHSNGLELEAFINGTLGRNGKQVGYAIKDSLNAERKRLESKHYQLDS